MSPTTKSVRARAAMVFVLSAVALVAGLLVLPRSADAVPAAPMQAEECDDVYGCPTSSTTGSIQPICTISTKSATPGTEITATISNIPVGTEVTLLFDGNQVGKEKATADGQGETALAAIPAAGHLSVAAPAQDASGGAVMTFVVPANAAVGPGHTVVFTGAGFSCDATGGDGFTVVASTTANRGGGSLSNTGMNVAIYLAVALVLIVAGAQLVRAARRRRRKLARRQRTGAQHAVRR